MTGPNLSHPDDGMVYACPDCDSASQLYERSDGSVVCYECGNEVAAARRLLHRERYDGHTLTDEERSRGGRNGHDGPEWMRAIAKFPRAKGES